jgi:hypothetical protein
MYVSLIWKEIVTFIGYLYFLLMICLFKHFAHFFIGLFVLQICQLCVCVCVCVRARARAHVALWPLICWICPSLPDHDLSYRSIYGIFCPRCHWPKFIFFSLLCQALPCNRAAVTTASLAHTGYVSKQSYSFEISTETSAMTWCCLLCTSWESLVRGESSLLPEHIPQPGKQGSLSGKLLLHLCIWVGGSKFGERVCGDGKVFITCGTVFALCYFWFLFFRFNWEGIPSSAVSLPSTVQKPWAHNSQDCIPGFIVWFKLVRISQLLCLIGRWLNPWEVQKVLLESSQEGRTACPVSLSFQELCEEGKPWQSCVITVPKHQRFGNDLYTVALRALSLCYCLLYV